MNLIKSKKHFYIAFTTILLLGVFLRLVALDSKSLRLDETQSVWQAMHSLAFIKAYMVKNVHLPLHNTALHFWMLAFGSSPTAVRMMAVIPGILSIPAIYLLSRELLNREKALYTALLASISPFWVWYSREIRMYSLLALVTTLSYYFFIKAIRTDKARYYIYYTLISIVGSFTHYYFLIVLAIQGIYYLITYKEYDVEAQTSFSTSSSSLTARIKGFFSGRKFTILLRLTLAASIIFLFFSPWLRNFIGTKNSGSFGPELTPPDAFNMFISFFEFTFGFQETHITALALGLWPLILLLSFIFLEKRKSPFDKGVLLAFMGTLIPVVLIFTISVTIKPIYLTRYLTPVTPMLYVLITWFTFELKGKFKYVFASIVITFMSLGLYNQFVDPKNPVREDYKHASEYVAKNATTRDIVLVAPPYNIYPVQYYYTGVAKVVTMPYWDKRDGGIPTASPAQIEADLDLLRPGHEKMYLLISENLANTEEVLEYMNQNFTKIEKREFSQDLWVHVYQAEYL